MQHQLDGTEKGFSAELERRLNLLVAAGRCEWSKEIRMVCFTHAARAAGEVLRIDYVAMIDGILVGFEVKRAPDRPAEIGQFCYQASQYACGVIGANASHKGVDKWTGKPLFAVFVVTRSWDRSGWNRPTINTLQYLDAHLEAAHRLWGPANVGFLTWECRYPEAFELHLCADRVWSFEWGWHRGMVEKGSRSGNGSKRVADTTSVVFHGAPASPAYDF